MNDSTTSIDDLKGIVKQFVGERNWNKHHTPKNISMSIAIEAAELMEHFQWKKSNEKEFSNKDLNKIKDETADVLAYILALANAMDIDLTQAIKKKMIKNAKKYPVGQAFPK